ncbi:MAG: hypothetical protein H6550_13250 [Chitinophagales bacterium]|nr:hypothetical protein [Chitinophagales bacterium]
MKKLITITVVCALGIIISCNRTASDNNPNNNKLEKNSSEFTEDQAPFPDFGYMLSPDVYHGPIFKLSQDYPDKMPKDPLPDFFQTDFKTDWRKYLEQVQQYCFEGNTDVDFRVEYNNKRAWYHMPWQHYGNNGREGIHGLTQEAPVQPYQLGPNQSTDSSGAVAVGFYNDIGGYTIGQVWKNHYAPDHKKDVAFKQGAVLFKLLFVTLTKEQAVSQVPYLVNGIWWDGYVVRNFNDMYKPNPAAYRAVHPVVLIQMDVMVRDDRSPTGWVLGNFMYNGELNKPDPWDNLIPVGIMWGDDPENNTNASNPKPTKTIINPDLKETIINPDANELPPTHLGWNSRLNGPVDNPMSSCFSCHSTAEYPQYAVMSPLFNDSLKNACPPGSDCWMEWFRNLPCGTPFTPEAHSMDFSLQLAISLQNFYDWKGEQAGLFASAYTTKQPQAMMQAAPAAKMAEEEETTEPSKPMRRVQPITFPRR